MSRITKPERTSRSRSRLRGIAVGTAACSSSSSGSTEAQNFILDHTQEAAEQAKALTPTLTIPQIGIDMIELDWTKSTALRHAFTGDAGNDLEWNGNLGWR